jgi:alpha-aminoadipate/glutamate carrier protein LysW
MYPWGFPWFIFDQSLEALIMAVVCPECDNPIVIDTDEVEEGETVQCDECGLDLEIVSVDPLELAPIDEAGYDDEDPAHPTDEDEE